MNVIMCLKCQQINEHRESDKGYTCPCGASLKNLHVYKFKCYYCSKPTLLVLGSPDSILEKDEPMYMLCEPDCENEPWVDPNKPKRYEVDLDTIFDEPGPGMFQCEGMMNFMQEKNITFKLLTWNGPGGGWPIIRFTGTEADLIELGTRFYDEDVSEFVMEIN